MDTTTKEYTQFDVKCDLEFIIIRLIRSRKTMHFGTANAWINLAYQLAHDVKEPLVKRDFYRALREIEADWS